MIEEKKSCKKNYKMFYQNLQQKTSTWIVIFERKTLSNRDENVKFVISSPYLPKTDINVKKVYANFLL